MDNGERISLLCEMVLADPKHDAHLMKTHNGTSFYLEGLVEVGFHKYALLDAVLVAQFPFPKVSMQKDSRLLTHSVPSWSGLRKIVDSCSGFGGISHGAQAMGFETDGCCGHQSSHAVITCHAFRCRGDCWRHRFQ